MLFPVTTRENAQIYKPKPNESTEDGFDGVLGFQHSMLGSTLLATADLVSTLASDLHAV